MTKPSTILQIHQLSKRYGKIRAVDDLSLSVEPGMVFGILGPNGSGKTTTLGIILDIIKPTSGAYEWFGGGYGADYRRHIGALLETPNFYPYLNAVDNLQLIAHIKKKKKPRIDYLLDLVNLSHRKHSAFRTYSLGMKQRLAIAAAMIGDPEVLIFDEPTNGLDPKGIAEVRQTLLEIAQTGKTIIMASHILYEVEKICSHVGIIKEGRLLATGTVGAIISEDKIIEVGGPELTRLEALFGQQPYVRQIEKDNGLLLLQVAPETESASINQTAFEHGLTLSHLLTRHKSLEAEFLEITAD